MFCGSHFTANCNKKLRIELGPFRCIWRSYCHRVITINRWVPAKGPPLQYIRETIITLDLANNRIRNIDNTYFAGYVRLRAIHLQHNLLSIVPNINYVASSITTLYLSCNKLNDPRLNLTQSFPRLHLLYLACNNISSFCMHETRRPLNLQVLDLSANTITHFDFQLIPHQHRNLFIALGEIL